LLYFLPHGVLLHGFGEMQSTRHELQSTKCHQSTQIFATADDEHATWRDRH